MDNVFTSNLQEIDDENSMGFIMEMSLCRVSRENRP